MRMLFILMTVGLCSVGCAPAKTPDYSEFRQRFIRTELPESANSLAQAVAILKYESHRVSAGSITVVGRIHAGKLVPFDSKSASFNLSELPAAGHNHDDPNDCPFCKRKAENAAVAVVNFMDDGAVIPHAADELLGLEKSQDVAVTGTATLISDMLVFKAESIAIITDADAARALIAQVEAADATDADAGSETPEPESAEKIQ